MNITPLFDRVLIQEEQSKENQSGFILSQANAENVVNAKVIAVGDGNEKENGKFTEMFVKIGDRVICSRYAITFFKAKGTEIGILRQSDILAVLK